MNSYMEKLKELKAMQDTQDRDKDKSLQQSLEAWKQKENEYNSALDSPTEFNTIELIKSISFVYLAPALVVFCYLLLPLQEPIVGFVHNYIFLIQSALNVLSIVGVYVAWGYIYLGRVWVSPLIITVFINSLIVLICICTYFPLKGLAIVGAVCVFVSYRILLPLLGKATHLQASPEFQRGVTAFAKLRLFFALAMFFSWAYLVLFFLYPELQLLYTFVYTTIMFSIKYTAILFTQKTTTKNFHGLAGFWMEFFHGMFGSIAFPQVSEWYVILFILLVQVATTGMLWVAFTDWWWKISRWILSPKSQRNQPRKISQSPPPSRPELHHSFILHRLTRDNKRGSQESLVPHETENIDNNNTSHDFIPINTSIEIPNPQIAQTQRPSFTKKQSLTQISPITEPPETLLHRISVVKSNQNPPSQENLTASISQALEGQLQKANFVVNQKSQPLSLSSSEQPNPLSQRTIPTTNQPSLLSTSSDSLLTNNSPETTITPPTPLPLSLNLPPSTNNSVNLNTSSSNIPLSLSTDIALQVPSNANFEYTQTREDFTQSMIKVTVLSIFSHTLVPLYYFPLSFYIRYSWNKIYFPYHLLTQSSFNSSLILSFLSFSIAILSMIVLNMFLKRRCAVSLWSILFPLLLQHKYYLALAILSGVSGTIVSIMYHYQLYYAFNK